MISLKLTASVRNAVSQEEHDNKMSNLSCLSQIVQRMQLQSATIRLANEDHRQLARNFLECNTPHVAPLNSSCLSKHVGRPLVVPIPHRKARHTRPQRLRIVTREGILKWRGSNDPFSSSMCSATLQIGEPLDPVMCCRDSDFGRYRYDLAGP